MADQSIIRITKVCILHCPSLAAQGYGGAGSHEAEADAWNTPILQELADIQKNSDLCKWPRVKQNALGRRRLLHRFLVQRSPLPAVTSTSEPSRL
jgi:hypothetical protein